MKKAVKRLVALVVLLAIFAALWFIRFRGVTHEQIYDVVVTESTGIQERIDLRAAALDQKLDRIEAKLDRLLDLADRPLPDNLQKID